MIQVVLRGGMGNQMFEYAAGLALAKRYGTELVLDTTYLDDRFPRRNFTYRRYELDAFTLSAKFTILSKVADTVALPGVWLGLDLGAMKLRDMFHARTFIKEQQEGHFDPSVMEAGGNVCLWGYWQSEKYFADAKDEVAGAFAFAGALSPAVRGLADEIQRVDSVALSVRRGDYVNAANAKIFGETNLKYYSDAIASIAARVPTPHFFIFSDDIEWCREHIQPPFPTTYVPRDIAGHVVMRLASLCKHNIIANSTFSWWGAWLNANPGKIVIAPSRWYGDQMMKGEDVIPDGWIKV